MNDGEWFDLIKVKLIHQWKKKWFDQIKVKKMKRGRRRTRIILVKRKKYMLTKNVTKE